MTGGGLLMNRREAFQRYQSDIFLFSRDIIGLPLRSYQVPWAQYICEAIAEARNEIITVEMPRQSGKNETSSQIQVWALSRFGKRGGAATKTAPTYKPQIVNSMLRFDQRASMAMGRMPFLGFRSSHGYIKRCHRAELHFLSADPNASVVGATASLFMEVDEAQDVDQAKYDKDFSPMRASTGAPVIAYGTTWTDTTLLERFKADVSEGRAKGRVFRITPEQVADANPRYGEFVDSEVARLGRDHPLVKTQYFLELLPNAGRMLKRQQLLLMHGDHERKERREGERQIVAGLDFAGADEDAGDLVSLSNQSSRDSVALTIGALEWVKIATGIVEPHVRILARYEWSNVNPVSLHTTLYDVLWNRWRVDRCHCDATGIGSTSTAFLAQAINGKGGNSERIVAQTFDSAWTAHTEEAFNYLAAVNGVRLLDYQQSFDVLQVAGADMADPEDTDKRAWWQRGHARLDAKPGKKVKASVPDAEGHDDLIRSELLMVNAAYNAGAPQINRRPRSREY